MKPNIPKKTVCQRIEMIALADIEPDSGYQRATNAAQVESIVNEFNPAKLGTLTVSKRDGKHHLVDGAHRSRALRKLGYTHAPCLVLTGLTYRQEANHYRTQNHNTRPLSPYDIFKAGLSAGDAQCVAIDSIVRGNGFQIGNGSKNFYKISAIQALCSITDDYGYNVLDSVLSLIASAWEGIPRASQSESLLGIAEFVYRYGKVDFAARLRDKFSVIWYDYTEAMRVRGAVGSSTSRKKFCRVLVGHYNKGFAHNSRKRLHWEGQP